MKFGRRLHEYVRRDWKDEYLNYDELKTFLKLAAPEYGGDGHYDKFLTAFDRELACADTFLEHRNLEISDRIREIQEEYSLSWDEDGKLLISEDEEVHRREEIVSALKELRTLIQQTIWYCRVHEEGFMIILNKLSRAESQRGNYAHKCREKYDQTQLTLLRLLLRGLLIVQSLIAQLIKRRRKNTTGIQRQQTLQEEPPKHVGRYTHSARKDGRGETGLHIAAREGDLVEVITFIRDGSDVNERVTSTRRTALHLAAMAGHDDVVQALVKAGADGKLVDVIGWTARDHAAFRGYLTIVPRLPEVDPTTNDIKPSSAAEHARTSKKLPEILDRGQHTSILVFLGSFDLNEHVKAVDLTPIMRLDPLVPGVEAGFALEVDILGGESAPKLIRLPILQDVINEPLVLSARKLEKAQIVFRIISLAWNRDDPRAFVGGAISLLQNPGNSYGSQTQSLIQDQKVPLLDKKDMIYMGSVNCSILTISPYHDGKYMSRQPLKLPKWSGTKTDVIGHRGTGETNASQSRLQAGKNANLALNKATELGTTGNEVDVQLTKDHVPVVYNDFLVRESGLDVPMYNIPLSDSQHLSPAQTWQPHTTLQDIIQNTPPSTSIMINVRYPMLWECTKWKMNPHAIEMNIFVDTILDTLFKHAHSDHDITLHSFNPDICILMSLKQRHYPVLFANAGGNELCGDQRANDLQEAIQFAKRWGLQGVVMAAEPYAMCPRLLTYTHQAGLLSSSYGRLNDQPAVARKLKRYGLNAIIVDEVASVVKALDEHDNDTVSAAATKTPETAATTTADTAATTIAETTGATETTASSLQEP